MKAQDRESLEALRDELGLNERVILPGAVRTPHVALKRADMFVSSLNWRAFPWHYARPWPWFAGSRCGISQRVSVIIEDGQNGILVPKVTRKHLQPQYSSY